MKFEGQYLTYEFYKLLGGSLDFMPFNLIEFKARKQVDKRTQNRLKNVSDIPNEVKLCMFNLVNQIETMQLSADKQYSISLKVLSFDIL